MGLFKNNYMFSKVTNYSFILNERAQSSAQRQSKNEKNNNNNSNIKFMNIVESNCDIFSMHPPPTSTKHVHGVRIRAQF